MTIGGGGEDGRDCYRRLASAHMKRFMDVKDGGGGEGGGGCGNKMFNPQQYGGGGGQGVLLQCATASGGCGGEDSGDSGLSSDNSGFSRAQDQCKRSPNVSYNGGLGLSGCGGGVGGSGGGVGGGGSGCYPESNYPVEVYPSVDEWNASQQRSPRGTMTRSSEGGGGVGSTSVVPSGQQQNTFNTAGRQGVPPRRQVDYASDTDVNYYQPGGGRVPLERLIARYSAARQGALYANGIQVTLTHSLCHKDLTPATKAN